MGLVAHRFRSLRYDKIAAVKDGSHCCLKLFGMSNESFTFGVYLCVSDCYGEAFFDSLSLGK